VIVLDACAALDWLLQTSAGRRIEERMFSGHESLHAPAFIDLDIVRGLQRLQNTGKVSFPRIDQALEDWMDVRIARYPHNVFLPEIWQYRHSYSPRAAAYLVLAKKLRATVLTRDLGLTSGYGSAMGIKVELF
jgi:predicted nucleic acid-binding protein